MQSLRISFVVFARHTVDTIVTDSLIVPVFFLKKSSVTESNNYRVHSEFYAVFFSQSYFHIEREFLGIIIFDLNILDQLLIG
jgi:hypothetical protein